MGSIITYRGRQFKFDPRAYDERIDTGDVFMDTSISCEELGIDTLDFTVHCQDLRYFRLVDVDGNRLLDPEGRAITARPRMTDLSQYVYGEPVWHHHDGLLVGKFFLASVKRVGKYDYRMSCVSGVGLLSDMYHYGGVYTGQPFEVLVADIIGGAIDYTVDPALLGIAMYGWLPVARRRDNLHQAIFAVGAAMRKDPQGNTVISALDISRRTAIPDDRVAIGGSIDYGTPATGVSVTEYSYAAMDSSTDETLFEGEVVARAITTPRGERVTGDIVTFTEPCHNLSVTGATILESGVNYAVLSGSIACTLTGKKYVKATKDIVLRSDAGGAENVVPVKDMTLVSLANSENVAARMLAYRSAAVAVDSSLVVGPERPGDAVTLTDPFDDHVDALMGSMDIHISNRLLADARFIANYVPGPIGNNYKRVTKLTGAGVYIVPEGIYRIRGALASGGSGGYAGNSGKDATGWYTQTNKYTGPFPYTAKAGLGNAGGEGGAAGLGGGGGGVLIITMDVVPGQRITYACGPGGRGALPGEETGQPGAPSIFGDYTTAVGGVALQGGYKDPITGEVFAVQGPQGIGGGSGSYFSTVEGEMGVREGSTVVGPAGSFTPGETIDDDISYGNLSSGCRVDLIHRFGGGASYGANGSVGTIGSYSIGTTTAYVKSGAGGAGASPTLPAFPAPTYGAGGGGGHGGGGGGAAGHAVISTRDSVSISGTLRQGEFGTGAPGGPGAPGGDGIILVYTA